MPGSVQKPSFVRARICASCLLKGSGLAPGTGTRAHGGLRAPTALSSEPPKCSVLTLRCSPGFPSSAEGQWDILQPPGRAGSIARSTVPLRLSSLLCTSRSSTPQGCVSPESADPSPAPGQPGQLKPSRRRRHGGNNAASPQRGTERARPLREAKAGQCSQSSRENSKANKRQGVVTFRPRCEHSTGEWWERKD